MRFRYFRAKKGPSMLDVGPNCGSFIRRSDPDIAVKLEQFIRRAEAAALLQ